MDYRRLPLSVGPLLCLLLCLFLCLPAEGRAASQAVNNEPDRLLKKIIIDNTITLYGHEFYRAFAGYLAEVTGSVYYDHVTLKEVRSSRSGNAILIEHGQAVLYRVTVYPADRYMQTKAKQAAVVVSGKIGQEQLNVLFSQGGDLAGDEL